MGERYSYMSAMNEEATQVVLVEMDRLYGKGFATDYFVDAFIMDWGKEESFHGVYSYPIVGTYDEDGLSKRQLLAKPIDNRVFFAGEATSNEHSATVHGALESGSRAAEEIIRIFLPQ
jgi:monoamine oxidase